jgi:hypothetical protein
MQGNYSVRNPDYDFLETGFQRTGGLKGVANSRASSAPEDWKLRFFCDHMVGKNLERVGLPARRVALNID